MKRLIALLCSIVGVVILAAPPAQADHTTSFDAFTTVLWPNSGQSTYCVPDEWPNRLTLQEWNDALTSLAAADARWQTDTDFNRTWALDAHDCGGGWSYLDLYNNNGGNAAAMCDEAGARGLPSTIHYEDFGNAAAVGLSISCDLNNNGIKDHFYIAINANSGINWEYSGTTSLGSTESDFRGAVLHEFAHAAGWKAIHWSGDMCNGSIEIQTMCPVLDPDFVGWRSPGVHDIGEVNQAY